MLKPGTIFPPVPIRWQGQDLRTNALRGQPALWLFPCVTGCRACERFFQSIQDSRELDYWSMRPLLVLPAGAQEPSTDAVMIDTDGRCRALAAPDEGGPALAVFDAYQEFRGAFAFSGHDFPLPEALEGMIRSALRADPG